MLIKTEAMNDKTRATLSAIGKALNIDAIPPVINDFNASQLHAYTRFLLGGWTVEQAVVLVSHIKPVVDSIYRMNQCLGRDTNRMDCMSRALDAILPLTNHSPDQEPLSATDIDTGSH